MWDGSHLQDGCRSCLCLVAVQLLNAHCWCTHVAGLNHICSIRHSIYWDYPWALAAALTTSGCVMLHVMLLCTLVCRLYMWFYMCSSIQWDTFYWGSLIRFAMAHQVSVTLCLACHQTGDAWVRLLRTAHETGSQSGYCWNRSHGEGRQNA